MKSVDQATALAQDIVARATRAGADAADAMVSGHASLNVSVRLGALEDVGRSEGEDLSLRVFCGRRNASVATSDFGSASLDELVARAIRMAKEAPEDKWAGLAPETRLLKGSPPLLDLDDGGMIAPEDLRERALEAEDAARTVAGVTNSEGAGAGASRSVMALATSHGFAGGYTATSYGVQASVAVDGSQPCGAAPASRPVNGNGTRPSALRMNFPAWAGTTTPSYTHGNSAYVLADACETTASPPSRRQCVTLCAISPNRCCASNAAAGAGSFIWYA